MDNMSVSSNTNKALQEIRDLPVALLKWGVERFSCFERFIECRGYSKVSTGRL
jgi:hypothetical protein